TLARDARALAAVERHVIEVHLVRCAFVRRQVEPVFGGRDLDSLHFPVAGGQLARAAAVDRHGVEVAEATLFTDEPGSAPIGQEACAVEPERARPAEPG